MNSTVKEIKAYIVWREYNPRNWFARIEGELLDDDNVVETVHIVLPDGWELGKTADGAVYIFGTRGEAYTLLAKDDGKRIYYVLADRYVEQNKPLSARVVKREDGMH